MRLGCVLHSPPDKGAIRLRTLTWETYEINISIIEIIVLPEVLDVLQRSRYTESYRGDQSLYGCRFRMLHVS